MTENDDQSIHNPLTNKSKELSRLNKHLQSDPSTQANIQNGKNSDMDDETSLKITGNEPVEIVSEQDSESNVISLDETGDESSQSDAVSALSAKTVIFTSENPYVPDATPPKPNELPDSPADHHSKPTRKVPQVQVDTQKIPDDFDRITPHRPDTAVIASRSQLRRKIETGSLNPQAGTSENREIILVIRGMVERLVLRDSKRVVLGRTDIKSRSVPDIDLTPYGALDRGVSREHATLHIEGEHLYVTDLDSTNGTYLAGKRITPYVPSILRKGDELLLGRLPVQVLFR